MMPVSRTKVVIVALVFLVVGLCAACYGDCTGKKDKSVWRTQFLIVDSSRWEEEDIESGTIEVFDEEVIVRYTNSLSDSWIVRYEVTGEQAN